MITELQVRNFTVFADARLSFGRDLNVFVGENGAGKTHILKLLYSILASNSSGSKDAGPSQPTKTYLQAEIARKLNAVFKPDQLGRLARRAQGRTRCDISCKFSEAQNDIEFSFSTSSKTDVIVDRLPTGKIDRVPVFLPTRELLTIYPGFVSLYETTHLAFEETWRDTCVLLGAPLVRGPREQNIRSMLAPLEESMNGRVELTGSGRFYLVINGDTIEMSLVAEGLRKLATIARLIATGSLTDKGFLFWDEPESNLNPKIIRIVAKTILNLGRSGIQVFIASHSLFLIRELDILLREKTFSDVSAKFFGLKQYPSGVEVTQGPTIDDIGDIPALEEDLIQADRYLESVAA